MILSALDWRGIHFWPAALIALAAVVAAVFLLYPSQVRSIDSRWRWALPSLRAAAIAALAMSVLRPVVIREKSAEEEGVVVILVDRSLSMGARDRQLDATAREQRTIGQLVALAEGLGRIPGGLRPQRLSGVVQEIRRLEQLGDEIALARAEIDYARLSGQEPREAQQRFERATADFLSTAARAEEAAGTVRPRGGIVDSLRRLARPNKDREIWTRSAQDAVKQVADLAQGMQETADAQLYRTDARVKAACDELARMSRYQLCREAITAPSGGLLALLGDDTGVVGFGVGEGIAAMSPSGSELERWGEPTAAASDLVGGVRQALRRVGGPVQAVVLFSDGRQTGTDASPAILGSETPVFTVYAGAERVRDLSLARIDMPTSVFVDEQMTVRVEPSAANLDVTKLSGEVSLSAGTSEAITRPLRGRGKAMEPVEFSMSFPRPGVESVVIGLPPQENEASLGNNQAERWVKVLAQKLRVIAISSSPNWDFRYLRDALSRTPWVDLREAIVAQGSLLAITTDEILRQDLVILSDVGRTTLTIEQWDAVRRLVAERGGSVILIPGPGHLLQQHSGHVIADLLPYPQSARPLWRIWPGQSPRYHLSPGPAGEQLPALRLDDDPEVSRRRWDELPGFYRYLAMPQLKPNARVLLAERDSPSSPILTESRFGNGRVVFLAMNETWRWRHRIGGRDQDRFWLQLVRYAADEPYALSVAGLSFDLDKVMASPDELVSVRARIVSETQEPLNQLELSITHNFEVIRTVPLLPVGAEVDGRYAVTLSGLGEGEYDLHMTAPSDEGLTEMTLPLRIVRDSEAELANLAGNPGLLRTLAESSGGKALGLEQVGLLPQMLEETRRRQPRMTEIRLWDSGYLFLFVLSCLTVEWAMRKRFGLA